MALSGSFNYSVDAATLVRDALENIGVVSRNEEVDSDDLTTALRTLNLLAKQWSSPAAGMPGLKVWLRRDVYLFAQKGQAQYELGPSPTAKVSETLNRTTISANEAAAQTALSVTSTTGMTANDVIGVEQNDGSIHWSTIASTGAGPTVTLNAALTVAADAGNAVYWYTTALRFMPLEIIAASTRRYDDDQWKDSPLIIDSLIENYELVTNKSQEGYPTTLWFEYARTPVSSHWHARISFDMAFGADAPKVVRLLVLSPADDIDASTDNLCFPIEFMAALSWELSMRLAPKFGSPWTESHQAAYTKAVSPAVNLNMPGQIGGYQAEDDGADDWNT